MLAAFVVAAGCAAWQPQAVGHYPGLVESDGEKRIEAWFQLTPEGRLQGHYVLHEATRDVAGTLDPVGDDSCTTAVFRWTDVYGEGLARLTFFPEQHCFDGAWGRETINPALVWHACLRERVTS